MSSGSAIARPIPHPVPAHPAYRFFVALGLALGLGAALVVPASVEAQSLTSNRVLQRLNEEAGRVPEARVLLYQDEEGEACVGLGIQEGPTPLRPGFLVFQLRSEDSKKKQRLDFDFDKKKVTTEGGMRMWTSCLPEEVEVGTGDQVQVTVRRPRRDTQAFVLEFPISGMAQGIDLWQLDDGRLQSTDRSSSVGIE